ncbi:MAG: ComF family protein [Gammaproteobacteria bacterium]
MKNKVYNWLKNSHSWLFPSSCVLCGDPATNSVDLCEHCHADLPVIDCACECCARPMAVEGLCGQCLRHPPRYHHTLAAYHYAPPVSTLVQRLKYNGKLQHARLLGRLMAQEIEYQYLDDSLPNVIVPMPLHKSRLRQRGFNQALELARPIADQLNIGIDTSLVERYRKTLSQSELPAKERRANVRGAFRQVKKIEVSHIAIIDDVMTTGASVDELARVLMGSNIERVDIWTCCRADSPNRK